MAPHAGQSRWAQHTGSPPWSSDMAPRVPQHPSSGTGSLPGVRREIPGPVVATAPVVQGADDATARAESLGKGSVDVR